MDIHVESLSLDKVQLQTFILDWVLKGVGWIQTSFGFVPGETFDPGAKASAQKPFFPKSTWGPGDCSQIVFCGNLSHFRIDGYLYVYTTKVPLQERRCLYGAMDRRFAQGGASTHISDCTLSTGTSKFHLVRPISRVDGEILSSGGKSFQEVLNLLPAPACHTQIASICYSVFAWASPLTP